MEHPQQEFLGRGLHEMASFMARLSLLMGKSLSLSSSLFGYGRMLTCKYQRNTYVGKNRAERGTKEREVLFVGGGNVIRVRRLLSSLSNVC